MPVFNGQDHLGKAIDTLLGQTFGDLELIISDNASTDLTAEVCRERAQRDARVRYTRSGANIGPVPNFQRALSLARGELFMWAAHDDEWAPTYLERCVARLRERDEVILVGTRTALLDSRTGDRVGVDPGLSTVGLPPHERFRRYKSATYRPDHYTAIFYGLYRRDALARAMPWPNIIAGDQVLLARLSFVGAFDTVPETLFFKRFRVGVGFEPAAASMGITAPSQIAFTMLWRELAFQRLIRDAPGLTARQRVGLMVWSWTHFVRHNRGWGLRTWIRLRREAAKAR